MFFLGTTPAIHDFWTVEGKARHDNKINSLKNLALLGGAVTFLHAADADQYDSNNIVTEKYIL